jgi:hypothetical protein
MVEFASLEKGDFLVYKDRSNSSVMNFSVMKVTSVDKNNDIVRITEFNSYFKKNSNSEWGSYQWTKWRKEYSIKVMPNKYKQYKIKVAFDDTWNNKWNK